MCYLGIKCEMINSAIPFVFTILNFRQISNLDILSVFRQENKFFLNLNLKIRWSKYSIGGAKIEKKSIYNSSVLNFVDNSLSKFALPIS